MRAMRASGKKVTIEDIINEKNLLKMSPSELDALVKRVSKDNRSIVEEYLFGKKAMNALIGKVMEHAKFRADAKDVIEILKTLRRG